MRIESSDHRVALELREPADEENDQFDVFLDGHELHVGTSVARSHQDRIRLTDWFSMLAAQWSGWDEEFTWDSDEGEFSLTARHDRVGRVFITAKFTPHWGAWQAEATLDIAPGDLEGITRKLMTFAKAGAKD